MANSRPGSAPSYVQAVAGIACGAVPDAGTLDQTALVQHALDSAMPGETVVLPMCDSATARFIKCGAIRIPSGVSLTSQGAVLVGATVRFSPSLSQAYNTTIKDVWFKQCKFLGYDSGESGTATSATSNTLTRSSAAWGANQWVGWYVKITGGTGTGNIARPIVGNTANQLLLSGVWTTIPDATSVYSIFCNINSVVFSGVDIDGTGLDNTGATSGDAVTIAEFGFDFKFVGGTQIWNYTGNAIAMFGNTDWSGNTGAPYLATGVFVCLSDTKIFNCGTGIRNIGGPQDGSSIHLSNVLIDHCTNGIYLDNAVSGVPGTAAAGSGGITLMANNVRTELCGAATGESQIYNNGASVSIFGLWQSSGVTTAFHRVNYHRSGSFRAVGGRCTTGASSVWAFYADPGQNGVFDVDRNYQNNRVGARGYISASEDVGTQLQTWRLRITKGATGVTVQSLSGSGMGWGLGSSLGDRADGAVSAEITAGGASASVGSNYTQVYYQLTAGGGSLQVTQAYVQYSKVVGVSLVRQTAGISGIYIDAQLLNAYANFNILFYDNNGAEMNVVSMMSIGQYIDVSVTLAVLR